MYAKRGVGIVIKQIVLASAEREIQSPIAVGRIAGKKRIVT